MEGIMCIIIAHWRTIPSRRWRKPTVRLRRKWNTNTKYKVTSPIAIILHLASKSPGSNNNNANFLLLDFFLSRETPKVDIYTVGALTGWCKGAFDRGPSAMRSTPVTKSAVLQISCSQSRISLQSQRAWESGLIECHHQKNIFIQTKPYFPLKLG